MVKHVSKRGLLLIGLLTLALLAAACGGGSSGTGRGPDGGTELPDNGNVGGSEQIIGYSLKELGEITFKLNGKPQTRYVSIVGPEASSPVESGGATGSWKYDQLDPSLIHVSLAAHPVVDGWVYTRDTLNFNFNLRKSDLTYIAGDTTERMQRMIYSVLAGQDLTPYMIDDLDTLVFDAEGAWDRNPDELLKIVGTFSATLRNVLGEEVVHLTDGNFNITLPYEPLPGDD